jgi:hypothetical protein
VIAQGLTVGGIATDIDGEARQVLPTIGADELPSPIAVTAVSRLVHAGSGSFDVALPGIECRSGGPSARYQIVFSFATPVTFANPAVIRGNGIVTGTTGNGTKTIAVDLTGVTDLQRLSVALRCASDGAELGDVVATMTVLVGDVNGDGFVNSGDAQVTRNRSGQEVTPTNFRSDCNRDAVVNSGDAIIVRARSGNFVP